MLKHLTQIGFQGLCSETFSDSELILKGSVTGIQPSIELVILLFLIRKVLVLFSVMELSSPKTVSFPLAFAASEVHCV